MEEHVVGSNPPVQVQFWALAKGLLPIFSTEGEKCGSNRSFSTCFFMGAVALKKCSFKACIRAKQSSTSLGTPRLDCRVTGEAARYSGTTLIIRSD